MRIGSGSTFAPHLSIHKYSRSAITQILGMNKSAVLVTCINLNCAYNSLIARSKVLESVERLIGLKELVLLMKPDRTYFIG